MFDEKNFILVLEAELREYFPKKLRSKQCRMYIKPIEEELKIFDRKLFEQDTLIVPLVMKGGKIQKIDLSFPYKDNLHWQQFIYEELHQNKLVEYQYNDCENLPEFLEIVDEFYSLQNEVEKLIGFRRGKKSDRIYRYAADIPSLSPKLDDLTCRAQSLGYQFNQKIEQRQQEEDYQQFVKDCMDGKIDCEDGE